ncbi:MAG: hypothetical protein JWN18_403 [Parcubacteria group bacterium]|nr:hypothetical protein [Parcubacteria group bacterium]
MYRELFDEKHRLVKGTPIVPGSRQDMQSGEYESDILCADCDNRIIGGYEAYASKVLYGGKVPVSTQHIKRAEDGLEITIVTGLDYVRFKLFLQSLLWRSSISSKDFFSAVNLGPYEEKLRIALVTGDPGPSDSFPCIVNNYIRTGLPHGVIAAPRESRFIDGKRIYTYVIAGMIYIFHITERETFDWILEAAVNENGEMRIPHMSQGTTGALFNKLLGADIFET